MNIQGHITRKTTAWMLAVLLGSGTPVLAAGPGGPPPGPPPGGAPPGGMPPMGVPSGARPMRPSSPPTNVPGNAGRESRPAAGFSRSPGDSGFPGSGTRPPGVRIDPPRSEDGMGADRVALNEAVSMVQQHFNATAVKTDTVSDDGQLVYRIRLLSADRSRIWTVSVDARTGQLR